LEVLLNGVETRLREQWLEQASAFLIEHLTACGLSAVQVRVSCGWPSSGGMGQAKMVIGQCFPATVCQDGIPQIFISPRLSDPIEVLATLLHELVHASVGCQFGHRKPFSQAARKVGLDGPPTATVVSDTLRPILQTYVEQVGAYPHAAIIPNVKEKKGSRLRLYECACETPVKVRVASDQFQARCLICDELFSLVKHE
jgi:hypothetical protein